MVLVEYKTNRCMKYVVNEGWFKDADITHIDQIDPSFRFDIDRINCESCPI